MPSAARLWSICERLQSRAQPARPPGLRPFVVAGHAAGWARPEVASFLAQRAAGFIEADGTLRLNDEGLDTAARSALLFEATLRLRDAGLIRGWRDEQLAIRVPPSREVLATVERAACRALGITTEAVHLNAYADDGMLVVVNRCTRSDGGREDIEGRARVEDPATNARLAVTFVRALGTWWFAFGGDYVIIGLDADYQWALVAHPSRRYGWILARTPSLPPALLADLGARLSAQEYDRCEFVLTAQSASGGLPPAPRLCDIAAPR